MSPRVNHQVPLISLPYPAQTSKEMTGIGPILHASCTLKIWRARRDSNSRPFAPEAIEKSSGHRQINRSSRPYGGVVRHYLRQLHTFCTQRDRTRSSIPKAVPCAVPPSLKACKPRWPTRARSGTRGSRSHRSKTYHIEGVMTAADLGTPMRAVTPAFPVARREDARPAQLDQDRSAAKPSCEPDPDPRGCGRLLGKEEL